MLIATRLLAPPDVLALIVRLPPFVFTTELLSVTAPILVLVLAAAKFTLSSPDVELIFALFSVIDPLAISVRLDPVPPVFVILPETVILPWPTRPELKSVVTVTLPPPLNAKPSSVALTLEPVEAVAFQRPAVFKTDTFALSPIVMSEGSISHEPPLPFLADKPTRPWISTRLPDVSIKPASPVPVASTKMLLELSSTVTSANPIVWPAGSLPRLSPPTITKPPPASPRASITLWLNSPIYCPDTTTVPPVKPEFALWVTALTSSVPLLLSTTPLSPPSNVITPLLLVRLRARMTPSLLTTVSSSMSLPRAVR